MKSSFFVLHSGVLSFLLGVKVRLSQVVKVFLQAKFVRVESSPYTEISDLDKVTKFNPTMKYTVLAAIISIIYVLCS
jgi:hypothetical protein